MPHCRFGALIAAALLTVTPASTAQLDYLGTFVWKVDDPHFGGFSGIEVTEDGSRFHALTDRAQLFRGQILRDNQGRITGMEIKARSHLRDFAGVPLPAGRAADSEGIAIAPDGAILISFEGMARVNRYDDPDGPATRLPPPPALPELRPNRGLESLAILPDGTVMTMPEASLSRDDPFRVLHFKDGEWSQPYTIRRDGGWLAVGSDYGPDGWFYLLERDFHGPLGFSSRIRRMQLTETGPVNEQILLESLPMQFDNLEGISAWDDGQGTRLTLISDDNFLFLQRTEVVEFRVVDDGQD